MAEIATIGPTPGGSPCRGCPRLLQSQKCYTYSLRSASLPPPRPIHYLLRWRTLTLLQRQHIMTRSTLLRQAGIVKSHTATRNYSKQTTRVTYLYSLCIPVRRAPIFFWQRRRRIPLENGESTWPVAWQTHWGREWRRVTGWKVSKKSIHNVQLRLHLVGLAIHWYDESHGLTEQLQKDPPRVNNKNNIPCGDYKWCKCK